MNSIVLAPSPVLSSVSKPVGPDLIGVGKIDDSIKNVLKDMEKALLAAHDPVGVGLAAPQIGKSLRIFIAKPTAKSKIMTFINPQILSKSEDVVVPQNLNSKKVESKKPKKSKGKMLEGCLSLPNIWGEVERNRSLTLTFLDENGRKHTKFLRGFMAIVAQHEIDHLDGILFPKRVLEQKGTLYESHKDEEGEDVFEELKI